MRGKQKRRACAARVARASIEALESRWLLNAADLDPGFGAGGYFTTTCLPYTSSLATCVAAQGDGQIVAAGEAGKVGDPWTDFAAVRVGAAGSLDSGFATAGQFTMDLHQNFDRAQAVAVQLDGKVLLAGYDTNGGMREMMVVRLDASGALDPTFGSGGKAAISGFFAGGEQSATGLLIQPDGKVVVVGDASAMPNEGFAVARLTSEGQLDPSFSGDGMFVVRPTGDAYYASATGAALDTQGRIVVGGYAYTDTYIRFAAVRITGAGELDTSFGGGDGIVTTAIPGGNADASAVAIQGDGKIVLVGRVGGSKGDMAVVRYLADGNLDTDFSNNGIVTTDLGDFNDYAKSVAIAPDGKILVAGWSGNYTAAVRYLANGQLDTTFGTGGKFRQMFGVDSDAYGVAIKPDGKIVLAGSMKPAGGSAQLLVVQLKGDPIAALVTANAGGPYAVEEGASVKLAGSGTVLPGRSIAAYEWDFNYDGNGFQVEGSGAKPDVSAAAIDGPATRTVGLRVRDNLGFMSDIATATITIRNVKPTATFSGPGSISVGQGATVSFTNVADPSPADMAGMKYSYDFDNNGTFEIADSASDSAAVPGGYLSVGSHVIRGRIADKDGAYSDYTTTIMVVVNPGKISGTLFNDLNGNGMRDAGEPTLAGRQVFIDLDKDGLPDPTDITLTADASGRYTSGDLAAGAYSVRQVLPAGWQQTLPPAGSGRTATVVSGQMVSGIDFGAYQGAFISGTIYFDDNANGVHDLEEMPAAGWSLFIDTDGDGLPGPGEPSAQSGMSGEYQLGPVPSGVRRVGIVVQGGYAATSPSGGMALVTLTAGQLASGVDFGVRMEPPAASAGGPYTLVEGSSMTLSGSGVAPPGRTVVAYEWDLSYDGQGFQVDATGATPGFSAAAIDGPGSRMVALRVRDSAGGVSQANVATVTITNANPTAQITAGPATGDAGLPVQFAGAGGDVFAGDAVSLSWQATDASGAAVAQGSDSTFTFTPPRRGTYAVTLTARDDDGGVATATTSIYARTALTSISGCIFNDANGDGVLNPWENPLVGQKVYVDLDGDGALDANEPTAITDVGGIYRLNDMEVGDYRVRPVLGSGWRVSGPAIGYQGGGLSAGRPLVSQDFALTTTVRVEGSVFLDANGNRKRDAKEKGLAKWRVFLDANRNGRLDKGEKCVKTNRLGEFVISGVKSGKYQLRVIASGAYDITAPKKASYALKTVPGQVLTSRVFGAKRI